MKIMNFIRFRVVHLGGPVLFALLVIVSTNRANAVQIKEMEEDQRPANQAAAELPDSDDANDEPVTDTASLTAQPAPLGDQFIRFHMWDGSIVGGDVEVEKIDIETEFGTLQVPIEKISKFRPGLDSIPKLNRKITELVEGLGDKDFEVREKSHRELVAMGLQIQQEIKRFDDGGSVERKKHLAEIKKEFAELADELERNWDRRNSARSWRHDYHRGLFDRRQNTPG